jgi:hypothetical protein
MRQLLFAAALYLALDTPGAAKVEPFTPSLRVLDIMTSGAVIPVRLGGYGPAALMRHGFGDTGDMWQALAVAMMNDRHCRRAGFARFSWARLKLRVGSASL